MNTHSTMTPNDSDTEGFMSSHMRDLEMGSTRREQRAEPQAQQTIGEKR